MKLKLSIFICLFASFLLMIFPNQVIESAMEHHVVIVNKFEVFKSFVNTCNILSIVFFFLAILLTILMWLMPLIERIKNGK